MASGGSDRDVNDETKGFSTTECIEEKIAFHATSSDQPVAGLEASKVVNDGDVELETTVLVDGKEDDAKVVAKVVVVADEQNSDEPNVLEGNGVI
ncbi:hypothetical protein Tco_1527221, partial [Tanacetum coccineum]